MGRDNKKSERISYSSAKAKKFPWWSIGLTLGIIFLVLGVFEQQFTDIYRKAVMICLECIGIG